MNSILIIYFSLLIAHLCIAVKEDGNKEQKNKESKTATGLVGNKNAKMAPKVEKNGYKIKIETDAAKNKLGKKKDNGNGAKIKPNAMIKKMPKNSGGIANVLLNSKPIGMSKECCQHCCGPQQSNDASSKNTMMSHLAFVDEKIQRSKRMPWTCDCNYVHYYNDRCNECNDTWATTDPCILNPEGDDVWCTSCTSPNGCYALSEHYSEGGCRWDEDGRNCVRDLHNARTSDPCITRPEEDDVKCDSCTTSVGCMNMSRYYRQGKCEWYETIERCRYVAISNEDGDPCITRPNANDVKCRSCTTPSGCTNLSNYYNDGRCEWDYSYSVCEYVEEDPCITRPRDADVRCSSCKTEGGCENLDKYISNGECLWGEDGCVFFG